MQQQQRRSRSASTFRKEIVPSNRTSPIKATTCIWCPITLGPRGVVWLNRVGTSRYAGNRAISTNVGLYARGVGALQWGRARSTAETVIDPKYFAVQAALQWGRALSSAETYPGQYAKAWREWIASMGPRSFDRGNPVELECAGASEGLQWGRGRSTAETQLRAKKGKAPGIASMGPRSFDRGNNPGETSVMCQTVVLQWGRGRSTAETWISWDDCTGAGWCFNGAALVRPRKLERLAVRVSRHAAVDSGFNGAAVVRPRKRGL